MQVNSIDHSAFDFGDGLKSVLLARLNRIVVVTGPNGAGKTRLLARIAKLAKWRSSYLDCLESWYVDGDSLKDTQEKGTNKFHLGTMVSGDLPNIVSFVSKNLSLTDPAQLKESDQLTHADKANAPGANNLAISTLPYIQRLQRQWWNAKHPDNPDTVENKQQIIDAYESLKAIVDVVLGEELDQDYDNRPTLFGRPIAQAQLSDGQRALLQWCVALHAQKLTLDGIILLMDEPENHLHPEAMIDAVKRIIDANPNGQIWISTHSVPLIAAMYRLVPDELSVFFMENGTVDYVGEQPERVLRSLMGGEDNVEALRQFVDLPEVFASNRFASECLLNPDVIASGSGHDPQAATLTLNEGCTRLLDYGAGAGRLLSCIDAKLIGDTSQRVDYVAWDVSNLHRETCLQAIATTYGEAQPNRWYGQRQALFSQHNANSFDIAVLCNVLHEIHPDTWVSIFNATSILSEAISDDGHVLIIEDYLMPKGEYAHPFGFIVLDSQPLQKLFGCSASDIVVRSERDGRVKGHYIPKRLLQNVTDDTVSDALAFAQRHAEEEVTRIRASGESSFKIGRAHGFWVQQYANTTLALSKRGSSVPVA